jgi:ubiquinone/menaquinone biosynthesis C-methylase UbiE
MNEKLWDPHQFREHFEKGTASNKVLQAMEDRKLQFYLDKLALKPGDVFLDIGCGYGRFSKRVESYVAAIIGIDINPDNVNYAKQYVGPKFQGHVVDLSNGSLPLPDKSVNKVLLDNVVTFLNRQEQVALFKEIRRVLVKGGVVAFNVANSEYLFRATHRFFSWLYKLNARRKGTVTPTHYAYPLDFYEQTLSQVGFRGIESVGDTYYRKMGIGPLQLLPAILYGYIVKADARNSRTTGKRKMSSITIAAYLDQ